MHIYAVSCLRVVPIEEDAGLPPRPRVLVVQRVKPILTSEDLKEVQAELAKEWQGVVRLDVTAVNYLGFHAEAQS